jgi:hypothetical protein
MHAGEHGPAKVTLDRGAFGVHRQVGAAGRGTDQNEAQRQHE